jgi:predicted outer membrane repeat protein
MVIFERTDDLMGTLVTLRIVRLTALVFVLVAMLWLLLARAGSVHAAGVVTNCSNDSDLIVKLGGGGLVTFNCLLPAPIIITVTVRGGIVTAPSTTIDGSNNGNPITLSGGGSTRLFHHLAAGSTLTLTHLGLSDGNAGADNGGCLYNEAGTAVLVDVTVTHCKTGSGFFGGGGIYNGGTATLTNVTFSGNTSSDAGGGIFNVGPLTLTLNNSTLSGNSAANDGGAILNDVFHTAILNNSTLSGNSAGGDGGGIYNNSFSTATLNHSTLSGNSASVGGGGINNFGTATLINSTLSGNLAMHWGGRHLQPI